MSQRASLHILRLATVLAFALSPGAARAKPRAAPSSNAVVDSARAEIVRGHYARADSLATAALERLSPKEAESLVGADLLDPIVLARRLAGRATAPATRELAERAVAIRERLQGPDHLDTTHSRLQLASVMRASGQATAAIEVVDRVLAVRERALPPDDPLVAEALVARGNALLDAGNSADARAPLLRALTIREKAFGPNRLEVAEVLHLLATCEYRLNNIAAARPFYERSLAIREQVLPPDHPELAVGLNGMATYYHEVVEYDRARVLRERALAIQERTLGPDHPAVASTLNNLGLTAKKQGDFEMARLRYGQVLAIRERVLGPEHPDTGRILSLLSGIEPDLTKKRALLERAVAIDEKSLPKDHPDLGIALHNLALVEHQLGNHRRAAELLGRAIDIFRYRYGPSDPVLAHALENHGIMLAFDGKFEEAMHLGFEAESAIREHFRLTAETLSEHEVLDYADEIGSTHDLMLSLAAAGHLERDTLRREAWDAVIRSRAPVYQEMVYRQRGAYLEGDTVAIRRRVELAEARAELARWLVQGPGKDPQGYEEKLAAARETEERAERSLGEVSATFVRSRDRERLGLAEIARVLPPHSALVGFVRYGAYPQLADPRLSRPGGSLEGVPGETGTYWYLALAITGPGSEVVAIPLGPAAELDALIGRWYAMVSRMPPSKGSSALAAEAKCRAVGDSLRRHIWDPIAARIGESRTVFLVPEGALYRVNFAALPAGPHSWLAQTGPAFHGLVSEQELVRENEPIGRGLLALSAPAFDADMTEEAALTSLPASTSQAPAFRGAPPQCASFHEMRFAPLPETEREAKAVGELWSQTKRQETGDVQYLSGPTASEAAFRSAAPGRRVVHLATHGFFLAGDCPTAAAGARGVGGLAASASDSAHAAPDSTARAHVNLAPELRISGLALAGANHHDHSAPMQDDGVLTAEEILALDLRGVEWAVLSACETGTGDIMSNEGVLGLRRAFAVAGARTIIMSLWSVDDKSARAWMTALYRHRLVEGRSTVESIRGAGLDVLKERKARGQSTHPFYWAGFVADGDWR